MGGGPLSARAGHIAAVIRRAASREIHTDHMQQTELTCTHIAKAPAGSRPRLLGSVVVPAYSEAGVLRRCLDALFHRIALGELNVTVVCNGCSPETANARRSSHAVRIIELAQASKSEALGVGDAVALGFPRLYLDADVVLAGSSARRVLTQLAIASLATRPPVRYDTSRSTALVRSYFWARSRMPAVLGCLWGASVYGLSSAGRARFEAFPDVGADDPCLDRQFEPTEIDIIDGAPVIVTAPQRSRDLLHTLRRTYRGRDETGGTPWSDRRARLISSRAVRDLLRLFRFGPQSGADPASYIGFAVAGRIRETLIRITRGANPGGWERDDSSRQESA